MTLKYVNVHSHFTIKVSFYRVVRDHMHPNCLRSVRKMQISGMQPRPPQSESAEQRGVWGKGHKGQESAFFKKHLWWLLWLVLKLESEYYRNWLYHCCRNKMLTLRENLNNTTRKKSVHFRVETFYKTTDLEIKTTWRPLQI